MGRDKKGELSAVWTCMGNTSLCSCPRSPTPPQALDSCRCKFLSPIDRSIVSFLSRLCTSTQTVSIPGMEKTLLAGCIASGEDWNLPAAIHVLVLLPYQSVFPSPILHKHTGRVEGETIKDLQGLKAFLHASSVELTGKCSQISQIIE